MHPKILEELWELTNDNRLSLLEAQLETDKHMRNLLIHYLQKGMYALPFLNWKRWDDETREEYGDARHIVAIYGINDDKVLVSDPALSANRNPVATTITHLRESLNRGNEQIIFVGK